MTRAPDVFIVVVRWPNGPEEFRDVVSADMTWAKEGLIVQLVYQNGKSDRWTNCLGAKVRNP